MAGRAGGRAETFDAARRRRESLWPVRVPRSVRDAVAHIEEWAKAEVAPGRLMPWLPIAFGAGILVYFSAEREPVLVAALALLALLILATFLARGRPLAFPCLLATTAMAAGFAAATGKSASVAHAVLRAPAFDISITGWIEVREERPRSDRIVVKVQTIEGRRLAELPERVRLSAAKGAAPPVGSFVAIKARLDPPLEPLRPGGYDFARDLYFQGIGATGFAQGAVKPADAPAPPSAWLRYAAFIDGLRNAIDARIRANVAGDAGAIASALITGKRDAISPAVNDAMYISSLAHVLSISGYHMAVVAGVVFFVVRGLLALAPALALRRPIKKWAAAAALAAAAFYLLLSGAEVATRRAFIMTAIVLVGVMVDRPALTLRNLALAALGVLLLAPEAVVHPSFQMSFAATLALVAVYERGLPWMIAGADTPLGARIALWGGREILALILASLVAGLATTLYASYHFHRLAPYGTLANLLAMPMISLVAMPSGLLALVALPFGFDGPLWRLMGVGIDWMIAVALWVASLPGAVGRIPAFGSGALLVGTAGLVLLCLLRTPLRWCGAGVLAIAILWALNPVRPDVLVADGGHAFAVRTSDGRLTILKTGNNAFAVREWLAADGDARLPNDPTLAAGFTCDPVGCIARMPDGSLASVALGAEAFEEDCARTAIVLSARTAPPFCRATIVDRTVWRAAGAVALTRIGKAFAMQAARPATESRPWARPRERSSGAALPAATQPSAREAAPPVGQFGPDD
ncbi:MAG: ComEC/Rec2 family competence protein [Xanthobacteraceae bacterium]